MPTPNTPAPQPPSIDWNVVTNTLADHLRGQVVDVLDGAAEDIEQFVNDISIDMTRAVRLGKSELQDELKAQLLVIAEINRVRVRNAANATLEGILNVTLSVVSPLLGNAAAWLRHAGTRV